MLARIGGIERGHDKTRMVLPHQQQAGALVWMGRKAEQPAHMRAGGQCHKPRPGGFHPGAQAFHPCHAGFSIGTLAIAASNSALWSATNASSTATRSGVKCPWTSRMFTVPTT